MSHDCCVALPRGAMGLSEFVIVVFPDHTHLLFLYLRNAAPLISQNVRGGKSSNFLFWFIKLSGSVFWSFIYSVITFLSNFAIILIGNRELVALL